jgi:hypothetical protein
VTPIPFESYINTPGVNWSTLKYMRDSPLHYRYFSTTASVDTAGREKGRALHTLVFEPQKFADEYAVFEGARRQGKVWDAFEEANRHKTILKADEYEEVKAQSDAVRSHPAVIPYLTGGIFEASWRWKDAKTGLICKGRTDLWHPEKRTLIDLKGTTTIHPHYFGRIAARQGYHCQLAHYNNGITVNVKRKPLKVCILAVESKKPHDLTLFELSDDDLYAGEEEVSQLLAKVAECTASGLWPGRSPEPVPLQLPPYIWGDDEDPADLGVDFGS